MIDLHLGNCLDVIETLSLDNVGAVIADPPYGIDGGSGGDSRDYGKGDYNNSFSDTEEYIGDVVVPIFRRLIAEVQAVVITPGNRCMHLYPRPDDIGCFWTPAAVTHGRWGFTTFQPILYYGTDWRAGRGALPTGKQVTERAEKNGHPCPKPLGAWTWLVDKVAPPGATVLDPFMGSGTTGVACIQTGRNFIGIEIDPDYFQIAQRSLQEAQPALPLIHSRQFQQAALAL